MADTRCVNPEYQLDVDVMILEYLLYQSIRAHFKASVLPSDRPVNQDGISALRDEANRLLLAFDSFIQIFRHTHKDYIFTESTSFNIKLLQVVVMMSFAKEPPAVGANDDLHVSPLSSFMHASHDEQSGFRNDRLSWLQLREILGRSIETNKSVPTETIQEDATISSWTTFQTTYVPPDHHSALFSILNRFMALSAEVSQIIHDLNGDEISDKWIALALETMLQTALSLLAPPSHNSHSNNHSDNNDHHTAPIPGLKECFAFGFLPNLELTSITAPSDADLLINDMFACTSPTTKTLIENPAWTTARSKYLSEFQLPSQSTTPTPTPSAHTHLNPTTIDPTPHKTRLSRLKTKYPYEVFERNLLGCLESFFIINTSIDVSDKPVLVQIEEGKLEGLEGEEFEAFLGRVGLVRDERGRFDFGLGLGGGGDGALGRGGGEVDGEGNEEGSRNGEGDRSRRRLSEVFPGEGGRWRT